MSLGTTTQLEYNKLSEHNLLTKNPVKDAFQRIDFQSQDFSSYSDFIPFQNAPSYGNIVDFEIPKSQGDAIRNICLSVTLNPLVKTSGTYACYTNTIGYALFEYVEFYIGEYLLFRKYREECDYDFYFDTNKEQGPSNVLDESQNLMIGKYANLMAMQTNAVNVSSYIVPLSAFMDAATFKSLFLFYLKHQSIKVKVKLAPFSDIVNYDGNTPPMENEFGNLRLYSTFYKLSQQTKERIINTVNVSKPSWKFVSGYYSVFNGASKIQIPFSGDTTSLVVALRLVDRKNNNDFFNYSALGKPIASTLNLKIDNIDIVLKTDEYTLRHYNNYYKLYPSSKYIYTLPFADDIKKWLEYTGSLNLRDTKHLDLNLVLQDGINFNDVEIIVFTKRYNWMIPENNEVKLMFLD